MSSEPVDSNKVDSNKGCKGADLLEVTFPDDVDLSDYHIVEVEEDADGKRRRGLAMVRAWRADQ